MTATQQQSRFSIMTPVPATSSAAIAKDNTPPMKLTPTFEEDPYFVPGLADPRIIARRKNGMRPSPRRLRTGLDDDEDIFVAASNVRDANEKELKTDIDKFESQMNVDEAKEELRRSFARQQLNTREGYEVVPDKNPDEKLKLHAWPTTARKPTIGSFSHVMETSNPTPKKKPAVKRSPISASDLEILKEYYPTEGGDCRARMSYNYASSTVANMARRYDIKLIYRGTHKFFAGYKASFIMNLKDMVGGRDKSYYEIVYSEIMRHFDVQEDFADTYAKKADELCVALWYCFEASPGQKQEISAKYVQLPMLARYYGFLANIPDLNSFYERAAHLFTEADRSYNSRVSPHYTMKFLRALTVYCGFPKHHL